MWSNFYVNHYIYLLFLSNHIFHSTITALFTHYYIHIHRYIISLLFLPYQLLSLDFLMSLIFFSSDPLKEKSIDARGTCKKSSKRGNDAPHYFPIMIVHADVVVVVDEYYWKMEKKEGCMHNINTSPSLLFFFYMYAHFFLKCHCTAMLLFTQEAPSSSSLCIMSIIYTILRIIVNIQTFKWTIFYIHTFTLIQKHTCIQIC